MSKRPDIIKFAKINNLDLLTEIARAPIPNGTEACLDSDPELFFSDFQKDIDEAKAICPFCPMIESCRNYAMKHENNGVWGGLSEKDRFKLRGNKDAFDPTDMSRMLQEKNQILFGTLEEVALRFEVDTRTVNRWREILRREKRAS